MENKKKLDGKSVSRVLDEYIKKSGCKLNEISSNFVMKAIDSRRGDSYDNYGEEQIKRITDRLALTSPYKIEFKNKANREGSNNKNILGVYLVPYKSHIDENIEKDLNNIFNFNQINETNLAKTSNLGLSKKVTDKVKDKDAIKNISTHSWNNDFDIYVKMVVDPKYYDRYEDFEFYEDGEDRCVISLQCRSVLYNLFVEGVKGSSCIASRFKDDELPEIFVSAFLTSTYHWSKYPSFRFSDPTDCRRWIKLVQSIFYDLWGIEFEFNWHRLMR